LVAQYLSFAEVPVSESALGMPVRSCEAALDAARFDAYGAQAAVACKAECKEGESKAPEMDTQKEPPRKEKQPYTGTLFLIGGDAEPNGSLGDLVKLAGKNAKIAIVCQASEDFDDSASINAKRFMEAGVPWENLIIITKPQHVFSDETIKSSTDIPSDTTVVFFAGGAQQVLKDDFTEKQYKQVEQLLIDGGIVAGSSAGAAVMSKEMIKSDDSNQPFVPLHAPGFGFLDSYVVDTHVAQRERQTRDVEALHWGKQFNENAVIAIDENTAVAISLKDRTARIYGHKDSDGEIEGQVHVFLDEPILKTSSKSAPYLRNGAPSTGHKAYEYDLADGCTFQLP
jgi:cyanophycinase